MKVTDMKTLKTVNMVNLIQLKRVMKRANVLYRKAKDLRVNAPFQYYLEYSWKLEKGFIWT